MSVRKYCHDNALPLSTYRYRMAQHRRHHGVADADATPAAGATFIAIAAPAGQGHACDIEVALAAGLTLRLRGVSAERVLAHVLERLA